MTTKKDTIGMASGIIAILVVVFNIGLSWGDVDGLKEADVRIIERIEKIEATKPDVIVNELKHNTEAIGKLEQSLNKLGETLDKYFDRNRN